MTQNSYLVCDKITSNGAKINKPARNWRNFEK